MKMNNEIDFYTNLHLKVRKDFKLDFRDFIKCLKGYIFDDYNVDYDNIDKNFILNVMDEEGYDYLTRYLKDTNYQFMRCSVAISHDSYIRFLDKLIEVLDYPYTIDLNKIVHQETKTIKDLKVGDVVYVKQEQRPSVITGKFVTIRKLNDTSFEFFDNRDLHEFNYELIKYILDTENECKYLYKIKH